MLIRNSVRPTVATVVGIITLLSTATMIAAQTVATSTDLTSEATTTLSLLPDLNESATTTLSLLPDLDGSTTTVESTDTSILNESAITNEMSTSTVAEPETMTDTGGLAAPIKESPTPTFDVATSTFPAELTCDMAYTADLYDTVSGHEEAGARIIGSQSWVVCKDEEGKSHEIKISSNEYTGLAQRGARMPRKTTANLPEPVISDPAPTSTGSTESITDTAPIITTSTSTMETTSESVDLSVATSTEDTAATEATTTPATSAGDETASSTAPTESPSTTEATSMVQ